MSNEKEMKELIEFCFDYYEKNGLIKYTGFMVTSFMAACRVANLDPVEAIKSVSRPVDTEDQK